MSCDYGISDMSSRDWDGSQQAENAGWRSIVDRLEAENAALWACVRAIHAFYTGENDGHIERLNAMRAAKEALEPYGDIEP